MKRTLAITAICLSLLPLAVPAQDSLKETHIRDLMTLTGSGKLGIQVMKNIAANFKQSLPNVPTNFWEDFQNEVKPEDLVNLIVPIYAKYFTDDDIMAMIAFYSSPVGKKFVDKLPLITQESMQAGEEWGKQLAEKIIQRLKEKGYMKST